MVQLQQVFKKKKAQYSIVLDLFNGSFPQDFKDSKLD